MIVFNRLNQNIPFTKNQAVRDLYGALDVDYGKKIPDALRRMTTTTRLLGKDEFGQEITSTDKELVFLDCELPAFKNVGDIQKMKIGKFVDRVVYLGDATF